MDFTQSIFCISVGNCDMMLKADGAQRTCSRLMDYDPSGQVLFRSVDIIWNILEHGSGLEVAEQLNNFTCIRYGSKKY